MIRAENISFILKKAFLLILFLCLIIGFCLNPVKSTVSYITSLSVTCVNTFTGEGYVKPTDPTNPENPSKPTDPTKPTEKPDNPPTSDSNYTDLYIAAMLICVAGVVIACKIWRKKDSI